MAARLKAMDVACGKGEETWRELQLLVAWKAHKGNADLTV